MYVLKFKKKVCNGTEGAHVTSHFSTNIKSQKLNSDSDKKTMFVECAAHHII